MARKYANKGKKRTPVTFRGSSMEGDSVKNFMEEWSLRQAEANHVETIEEANDFEIHDEEDEDFFEHGLTVYEMHEAAEDNLALLELDQVESNETIDSGADLPKHPHDQSAPIELNSPDPKQPGAQPGVQQGAQPGKLPGSLSNPETSG